MASPDIMESIIKGYERKAEAILDPGWPVVLRLDGIKFSTWTAANFDKFDKNVHQAMVTTALALAREVGASYCYTQSDEISLVVKHEQLYCGGRVQKLSTHMATLATVVFNEALREVGPLRGKTPRFDCRSFNVPNETMAVETILWRERSNLRNAIFTMGSMYLRGSLEGVSTPEIARRLTSIGQPVSDMERELRYGSSFHSCSVLRQFTSDEIENLPPHHNARKDPNLTMLRRDFLPVVPNLGVCENKVGVVFNGETPSYCP